MAMTKEDDLTTVEILEAYDELVAQLLLPKSTSTLVERTKEELKNCKEA